MLHKITELERLFVTLRALISLSQPGLMKDTSSVDQFVVPHGFDTLAVYISHTGSSSLHLSFPLRKIKGRVGPKSSETGQK